MSLSRENNSDQRVQKLTGFQEDLEHLMSVTFFRGLEYECLKLLAMLCRRIEYEEGDELMAQGEEGRCGFLILSGRLEAAFTEAGVRQEICDYGSGKFLGGCALFDRVPLSFALQAKERTVVLQLSREDFQKVVHQFPASTARVAANLVSELVKWDKVLLRKRNKNGELDCRALGVSLL